MAKRRKKAKKAKTTHKKKRVKHRRKASMKAKTHKRKTHKRKTHKKRAHKRRPSMKRKSHKQVVHHLVRTADAHINGHKYLTNKATLRDLKSRILGEIKHDSAEIRKLKRLVHMAEKKAA